MDKKADLAELREHGVLQEVNRQFFHPLGLALAFTFGDDGHPTGEVLVLETEDSEGIAFLPPDATKAKAFTKWKEQRCPDRVKGTGWEIEPLPKEE